MPPESKSPLALAREAVELAEKATPGPWYFRCTDDAHFMNARMVSTDPTPIEHSGWTGTHDGIAREDFKEAICVTLLQLAPQICREDGKEDENAELIAHAGSHYAAVARAALKVVECVQTRREIEQAIMDTRKLDNHADALRRRTILVARLQDAEKAEDVAIDAWKAGE